MSTTKTCRFIKDSLARVAVFTRTFGQQMNKTLETKEQSLANDISHFVCYYEFTKLKGAVAYERGKEFKSEKGL